MTERENALKAFHHQKPDWIPLTYDAVQEIGFGGGNECGLTSPDHKDIFGVQWVIERDPTPDPNNKPLVEDIEEWESSVTFPKPREWDWDAIREAELAAYDPNKVMIWFSEQGLFDRICTLCGTEDAMCNFITNPDESAALLQRIADYKIELVECVAEYIKPDVFMYTDDVAAASGLMISPEIYRKYIKPAAKRIFDAIRKTDMIPEQHCCGKCEDIIDDFVEMGAESFFPAQVLNDLKSIQKKYHDRLTIRGGYDSQGEAGDIHCSDEAIIKEARRMVDDYGELGGYIAMPMIMDGTINWSIYEPSHRQKVFRDEFYRYSAEKGYIRDTTV